MHDLLSTTPESHEVVEFVKFQYRVCCVCAKLVQLMVYFSGRRNSRFECLALRHEHSELCLRLFVLIPIPPLFWRSVKGIKLMFHHRAIQEVDVNEVLANVVESIKYRAFW
ncbi:hypothetical protein PsorP6_009465 [Peronosclerospora sorghi]|uniref:Uncharacterized protein n=1 Tax=Peronosclerospora sorghi TaxID=230839 RepID=A0ACC0W301_9STRA|nr:hypothetical protein PsorP6_009465 [Peronosclerospora sorghi]